VYRRNPAEVLFPGTATGSRHEVVDPKTDKALGKAAEGYRSKSWRTF